MRPVCHSLRSRSSTRAPDPSSLPGKLPIYAVGHRRLEPLRRHSRADPAQPGSWLDEDQEGPLAGVLENLGGNPEAPAAEQDLTEPNHTLSRAAEILEGPLVHTRLSRISRQPPQKGLPKWKPSSGAAYQPQSVHLWPPPPRCGIA